MSYLEDDETDIACLQETWLKPSDKSTYQMISEYGYKILKKERPGKRGGGLMILYKPHLKLKKFFLSPTSVHKTFEYLCCKMLWNDKIIKIVNIYRIPYSTKQPYTIKMFMDEFTIFMSDISESAGLILLCGDFNINFANMNDANVESFVNLVSSYNLRQMVKIPTHVKGGLLDLIMVDKSICSGKMVVETDQTIHTDHYPVKLKLPTDYPLNQPPVVIRKVRDLHTIDVVKFKNDLKNENITDPKFVSRLTISESIDLYNSTLTKLLDVHCPLVDKKYRSNHLKSKWFNDDLQRMKQIKRRAERKFRKVQSKENKEELSTARNRYNFELKEARSKFYQQKISDCEASSKDLYGVLGKITGRCKEKTIPTNADNKTIAEEMGKYYTEKIVNIRNNIKAKNSSTLHSEFIPKVKEGFYAFTPINSEQLMKIISTMKNKTCRSDPMPTSLVKSCMSLLQHILLHIINISLSNNVFPHQLKTALVTPIIKDENKNAEDFKNYRPVSNLPFLAKLLETVMYIELNDYIESYSLHSKYQSAYRRFHSCETALVQVVDDIQQMISNKQHVSLVLLDSSSAFDTVDHDLMLQRLEKQFSISCDALTMIKSYLTDRTFSIVVGQEISEPKDLKYGVPQGSILGPLFYLLYTNDIETIAERNGMKVHVYADDCKIYFSYIPENVENAEAKLRKCIDELKTWMDNSFLKLNTEKTSIKLFKPDRETRKQTDGNFCLMDTDTDTKIRPSTTVKVLGVTLGPRLDFKEFAMTKIQTCNLQLRNLWAIRKCLTIPSRIILVTNLILSTMDYCNALLISAPKYIIDLLQKALNKAIRFIFDIKRRDHITPYLYKLHILPVSYRIKFKVGLIAYKVLHGIAPLYLSDKMNVFRPTTMAYLRPGTGRDTLMFDVDVQQRKIGSVITKIMVEWNSLPLNIRNLKEITVFKSHLKTHLFKMAFSDLI